MLRPILLATLFCAPSLAGCLEVERPCPENTCFPLTSSAFNSLLEEVGEMDALQLSSEYGSLSVRTTTKYSEGGISGEIVWIVEKDDSRNLRLVSHTMTLSGSNVVGYEIWDGGPDTFSRTSGHWMVGRDMVPDYEDPFIELARLATQNPDGIWPPFRYDVSEFSGLSWTITGDAMDSYQIARATNGPEEIYFEIHGLPPRIVGLAIYQGSLDPDDITFEMSVATDDWEGGLLVDYYLSMLDEGGYLSVSGLAEFPKSPAPFIPVPDHQSANGDWTIVIGTVPEAMAHEATLSEMEMHAFSEGFSVASLMLNEGDANITAEDGTWWDLTWVDAGQPGLLSRYDTYSIRTNSSSDFEIRIFDHWAQAWTDHSQ